MNFLQGSMTVLVVTIFLAACSDNKDENTGNDVADIVKNTTNVTDTNLQKSATAEASFTQLLSYVPADTAYLAANKVVMPEDVMAFHLKRSKQVLQTWMGLLDDIETSSEAKDETSSQAKDETSSQAKNETVTQANESDKELAVDTADQSKAFFVALLEDLVANMSIDKIANTGLKADGHGIFYGVDLAPVLRYEITSKAIVRETIKRAEAASGYTVAWQKCGNNDCIELDNNSDTGKRGAMLVLHDDHIAGGLFTTENKQTVIDHLTGKSKVENSYPVSQWNSFLLANKYSGYGDGYVDLKKVYHSLEKLMIEEEKKRVVLSNEINGVNEVNEAKEAFDEKSFKACSVLVHRHLEHVPEAVFGIKNVSQHSMEYEVVLKTSPVVSTAISAIPNTLMGMQQATDPVFDIGLNLNFGKLREGLTQYTQFLIKTADEVHCDAIKPNEIRKAMGGFTMATMMGVNQFKAIYVSVNDLKMSAEGRPEKIDFYASVFADQPAALLQMLGMINPAFATITLPEDGTPIKLPEGLVPPNPTGVSPEIYVSKKDHLLNIMVGDTQPDLKPFKTDTPAFFWNTVDSKRYYQTIGDVMRNVPVKKGTNDISGVGAIEDIEAKKAIELMAKMGEFTGKIRTQVGADTRGVVINYSVEYDK